MRARRGRIIRSRVDLPQQEVWSRFLIALLLLAIAGCASVEKTTPETAETYLDRAQTQTQGPIRVIATVPSAKETRKLFVVSQIISPAISQNISGFGAADFPH